MVGAVTAVVFRGYLQQTAAEAILGRAEPVSPRQPAPAAKAAQPAVEGKNKLTTPGRPIEEDEPAFWSDIEIYNEGPGHPGRSWSSSAASNRRLGIYPTFVRGYWPARSSGRGSCCRREELGAITRDVLVGDPEVAGKPDAVLRIGSRFRVSFKSTASDPPVGRITLVDGTGANRRVLLTREFDCGMIIAPKYGLLVEQVEYLSRLPFRQVLEDLGLKRTKPAQEGPADGGVPDEIEARLGQLVESEQFALIRDLHAAVRTRGETPALLPRFVQPTPTWDRSLRRNGRPTF